MTAGLATALLGGTAPVIDQILVSRSAIDVAPGIYVSVAACVALVALRRWPRDRLPGNDLGVLILIRTSLATDLDEFDAGVAQGVEETPQGGIVQLSCSQRFVPAGSTDSI